MEDGSLPDMAINNPTLGEHDMMNNIDDLFGEADDVLPSDDLVVALPVIPPPHDLILRLTEMQSCGCCTRLAWSNTGSIAQISSDGQRINFRTILRNGRSGVWNPSNPSEYSITAPTGTSWRHLRFSGIGVDLAATDSAGVVHVYTLMGALERMHAAPTNVLPSDGIKTDLEPVVYSHWLPVHPTEFKIPQISAANKSEGKWETTMSHRNANEPKIHHAIDTKHALFHVTRNAQLGLMYQNELLWHSTSIELESISSTDELLTHASMCEEGDHLLLVTHDQSKRFRVYRIKVSWNDAQHPRAGGPPTSTVNPSVEAFRIASWDNVSAHQAEGVGLTHLRILPTIPNHGGRPAKTYPTIFAVFTQALQHLDATQAHPGATFSVVSRWHIESAAHAIHESFGRLKVNGSAPPSYNALVLRRQHDVAIPKIILSIEPQQYHTLLAMTASDGTVDFRHRATMSPVEANFDLTTCSSLPQSGFEQMAIVAEHATDIALSPDASCMVYITADGQVRSKMMTFRYSWQPIDDGITNNKGLIEAAVVCLARQYAMLCCSSAANDENLALIPPQLSSDMRTLFIREVTRMTNRTLDISALDFNRQQQTVVREPLLPRIMSAQYVIGVKPGTTDCRSLAGRFAYAFLNARLVCTSLAQMIGRPEFLRPDILHSLRGHIKWGSDFLIWILSSLLTFARTSRESSGTTTQSWEEIAEVSDSPVFNILFCTFTRTYLRFLVSLIPKYLLNTQKVIPFSRPTQERQQLVEIVESCGSIPFKYTAFESWIGDLDDTIRTNYIRANVSTERRTQIELQLLTASVDESNRHIPIELRSITDTLMNESIPRLVKNVDVGKLYFWNTEWIGLAGATSSKLAGRFDVVRKLPLTKSSTMRICRRCGSKMDDIPPEKARELPLWLAHAQRYCICLNYWITQ